MLQVIDYSGGGGAEDIEFLGGAINVVLGSNHSGKTDLCRLIAGLETPLAGEVYLDGEMLARQNRPVSMVSQSFVNYPNWSVGENIASPFVAQGRSRDEIRKRVREVAALLRIDHLVHRMPDELSGGQQQRVAIARAIAGEPRVLLMDEPFVNIDFKLREELNLELRTLVESTAVCLLFTSSDPSEAISLADRLVLLNSGQVEQAGDPLDLYRYPRSVVAAHLMSDPGVNQISATEFVRPEHISIEPLDGLNLAAEIRAFETNGAETYIHADVMGIDETGPMEWVIKLHGMHQVPPGPRQLFVRSEDVLRFPHG